MRNPFGFALFILLTLFAFQCLPMIGPNQIVFADENTVTQEKKSPSFTVKGQNINITPLKQESVEKQSNNTAAGGDQPHLVIDSANHDVGEVWEGEDIIHSFTVKNTGTAQLAIKKVKAG
jgi:hypothetical protein